MIYKLFTGNHIDLSKIVDISEPIMIYGNYSSCLGTHVSFEITFQLMDKSNVYNVFPNEFEIDKEGLGLSCNGASVYWKQVEAEDLMPDVMVRTQQGINKLIEAWNECNNTKN